MSERDVSYEGGSRKRRREEHSWDDDRERSDHPRDSSHRHARDGAHVSRHRDRSRSPTHLRDARKSDRSPRRHQGRNAPRRRSHCRSRSRSRSPRHRDSRKADRPVPQKAASLPFGVRHLSKSGDLATFRPLFAYYLDIQKSLDVAALDEREFRGRWKSFVGKWNRGELAEGWYDPDTFTRSRELMGDGDGGLEVSRRSASAERRSEGSSAVRLNRDGPDASRNGNNNDREEGEDNDDDDNSDDDDIGPALPPSLSTAAARPSRAGAGLPTLHDLSLRREQAGDEAQSRAEQLRLARKADRAQQRERLDELAPRAEPGTRERMLEKRAAVADKMRSFRERSPGAGDVPEREVMGGGDSIEELKRLKANEERRKTERELRREEIARARRAEREERVRGLREREEETVAMLRELARERFG